MSSASFGGEGKKGDARARAEELAAQLRRGDRDVRQLIYCRFRNNPAVTHKQNSTFSEASVLDFHDLTTGCGHGVRGDFDDLEQRSQHAATGLVGARNETVSLMHRDHHGSEIVR